VSICTDALPLTSVPTVSVFEPLAANMTLGPPDGAVNVTGVPATAVVIGQPSVFANSTCNGFAKPVWSGAVCGVPPNRISSFGALLDEHPVAPVAPVDPDGADCARAGGLVDRASAPATIDVVTVHPRSIVRQRVRISRPRCGKRDRFPPPGHGGCSPGHPGSMWPRR
jgi:hypothetical protein